MGPQVLKKLHHWSYWFCIFSSFFFFLTCLLPDFALIQGRPLTRKPLCKQGPAGCLPLSWKGSLEAFGRKWHAGTTPFKLLLHRTCNAYNLPNYIYVHLFHFPNADPWPTPYPNSFLLTLTPEIIQGLPTPKVKTFFIVANLLCYSQVPFFARSLKGEKENSKVCIHGSQPPRWPPKQSLRIPKFHP